MKNWYLLVHWDGTAVTGFLVMNQPDEESARKALLYQLIARKKRILADPHPDVGHHLTRTKAFIKAIAHPWRHTKKKWHGTDPDPLIQYIELTDEVIEAGYWLDEVVSGEHYCNLSRYRKNTQ